MTRPALRLAALLLCAACSPLLPDDGTSHSAAPGGSEGHGIAIAPSKPRPPLGRPPGPYKPGSTVVWQNWDGTLSAIKVHPRSEGLR